MKIGESILSKTKLVYDYDPVIFKACCAVELRQIKCTNTLNKEEHVFKSRTEFYGDWRKKVISCLKEIRLYDLGFIKGDTNETKIKLQPRLG